MITQKSFLPTKKKKMFAPFCVFQVDVILNSTSDSKRQTLSMKSHTSPPCIAPGRSLTKRRKTIGPRFNPWETPVFRSCYIHDLNLFIMLSCPTWLWRPVIWIRNDKIKFKAWFVTPNLTCFSFSSPWCKQSNAFVMS